MFRHDSPIMRIGDFLMDLFLSNVLYALMCIPGASIVLAGTALYKTCFSFWMSDDMNVFPSFFRAIRENWKESLLLTVVLLIFAGIGTAILLPAMQAGATVQSAAVWFALCLAGVLCGLYSWLIPMVALFQQPMGERLKNAWMLSVRHFPVTVVLVVIRLLPIILFLTCGEIVVNPLILVMITVGFSLQALLCSRLQLRVFQKYDSAIKPQNKNRF